jgi:hypothetical protein
MALIDDLLSLTLSYIDITEYISAKDLNCFVGSLGSLNPEKILQKWWKSSRVEVIKNFLYVTHTVNGKKHRIDGPAFETTDGRKEWWMNGKLHRTDGPAIESQNGDKSWWVDGKLQRTDGPAIELSNGGKEWWVDGKRHRTDGPAIELSNGGKEWWVDGKTIKTENLKNRKPKTEIRT